LSTGPVYGASGYPSRIVPQFSGTTYVIEQKILAIRDTFGIKDQNGNLLAYVKKEFVSFGPRFWFESPTGQHLGQIHGKVLAIRPTFEIYDSQGQLRAQVKKKLMKLFGEAWWMEDASGNEVAKVNGNILEHDYYMQNMNSASIAQIHKKWISVRDSYNLEMLNPSFDPYLALAYAISLDNTEKKEDRGKHRMFR
jgi:uncharacterized protein YxjI